MRCFALRISLADEVVMRMPSVIAVVLCAAACAGAAPAREARTESCLTLSFAPLDVNVPACTALIDDPALDEDALADALAARAEAYEFALTYHGEHEVAPEDLLAAALADLGRAAAIDARRNAPRGDVLYRLGRFDEAAESYALAIEAEPSAAGALLESRAAARAAAGDHAAAIGDMTAAMGLAASEPDRRRLLMRRGELYEAAGDRAAALDDFQALLAVDPSHAGARNAVARLTGADE